MMNLRAVLIKKKTDCLALNNIWHTADRQWEKRKKEERDRKKERLLQEKTYSISVYTIMKSANISISSQLFYWQINLQIKIQVFIVVYSI